MTDANTVATIDASAKHLGPSAVARVVCALLAIALLALWCWFSFGMSSLALDYPLRRAGENAEYPAFGTFAFFLGCGRALARVFTATSYIWLLPMGLALFLMFRGFALHSLRSRLLSSFAILTLPIICYASWDIHRHMQWARESAVIRQSQ